MSVQPTVSLNQFAMTTVRGVLDFRGAPQAGTVLGVQISPNQVTPLYAGDAVKLDSAAPAGGLPQVIAAADSDVAWGFLAYSSKASTFNAGDRATAGINGAVMWGLAESTINPGSPVESTSDGALQTKSANPTRGTALDAGTADALFRFIIANPNSPLT